MAESEIRLQWDPDHDPSGAPLSRRAIQLGLRGEVLAKYAREWIVDIEDITDFVHQQYQHVVSGDYTELLTPTEAVYPVASEAVRLRLQLSQMLGNTGVSRTVGADSGPAK